MKRFVALTVVVTSLFSPYFARADSTSSPHADTAQLGANSNPPVVSVSNPPVVSVSNPPVPDITNWNVVNMSRTALNVSDVTIAYLGLEIEYSNPTDPREFVKVTYRHISLIISKLIKANARLLSEMVTVFYTQKEEQDRLLEVSKKSDPIIYTWWRTKENPRTGYDMLDGDFDVWFLPPKGVLPDGSWPFFKNQKVETEFMTENVGNGTPHNVFGGMKYQIGDLYHIIRVDRNDLLKLFKADSTGSPQGGK